MEKVKGDSLGDRIKRYENANRSYLTPKMPVIIRVDGRAFHTYVRGSEKPFDARLMASMDQVAITLCEEIPGCQIAYVQSDEISLLLNDYKNPESQQWFGGNIQKMVSVSASIAAVAMTMESERLFGKTKPCSFDSRVFVLPKEEVVNMYIWRQQDWSRNSVQMLTRSMYSDKEVHGKNTSQMHDLCHAKGKNWNDLPTQFKRGRCVVKMPYEAIIEKGPDAGGPVIRHRWEIDKEIPIFTQDRNYIERFV